MSEDKYINGDALPKLRSARGTGVTGDGFRFEFFSTELETVIGATNEVAATSDTGAFSLTRLFKRLLSVKLPDAVNGRIPVVNNATYGNPTLAASSALGATAVSFDVSTFSRLRIQINNTGANPLNGFEISTKAHATGDPQVHLNAPTHFTAPAAGSILRHCGDLTGALADPTTLAAAGKVVLALDFRDFFASEIRIRATSVSGTALQIYWGAS
jgi:hypothetical protein